MKAKQLTSGLALLFTLCLTSCSGSNVHHEAKDYFVDVNYKTDFKILQMSDIHLGMKDDLEYQFKFMDLTLSEANPNLIIITGDVFTFGTKETMKSLFSWLDSYKIPWGITFGNHDEQVYFSMSYLSYYLSNNCEYCKFIDYQDDDVFGSANYCINLTKDGSSFYQLYMFDSNRYYYGSYFGYDYIHEDQIEWYERLVNYSTELNSHVVPSLSFFHIPLVEYKTASDLVNEGSSEATLIYGENNEKISCPKYNSGLFTKMVELGSTKGVFVGHDHINNSEIMYQGIDLVYGVHSTDRVYHLEDMMGGLVITIHDDASFSLERIYHTYSEVK